MNSPNFIKPLPTLSANFINEQTVSMRDYVDLLAEGKKIIITTVVIFLTVSLIYLILAPRTYKADALLRIDKDKALLSAPLRGHANSTSEEADNPRAQREVELIRSRSVLGKVVDDLNLTIESKPVYFPVIGNPIARKHKGYEAISNPWWGFNKWAWGGEKLQVATFNVPDRYLDSEFTLVALEAGRFLLLSPDNKPIIEGSVGETLSADLNDDTPIQLKVIELDAHEGTHFELIKKTSLAAIDTLQKAFSVKEVSKDTDILSVELKGADPVTLAKSVNDIANIYVNATINWESAEASQKLTFLENQLPIVRDRLEKAELTLSNYRQQHGAVDITAEAEILMKQAAEMETMNIQLKQKYEEQSQLFEDAHPDMVALKAQMKRVDRKLAELEKRIKDLPKTQQNMVTLSRDVQVNTELYTSLLNSAQEQRIAAAGSIGKSRIVDYAVAPEQPYWPKPGLLLAISVLLGMTMGSAIVFLRHSMQRHPNFPAYLEHHVGLPLFAAIPHSKQQGHMTRFIAEGKGKAPGILVNNDPLDITVESLRSFRTTLESTLANDESQVIMLSSPAPGMGKSFVSANLAALLASINKRVLIIDADMRNGRLHETFAVYGRPGFSDLLSGKANLDDIIISLPNVGVDFIPRGNLVTNPAELLVLGNLEGILEQLKSFYNHIVIDSPPVLGATDAVVMSKHVNAMFLVVKDGRYTAQELEVTYKRFQQIGIQPKGFIMNDMKESSSYYPYYGYKYSRPESQQKNSAAWLVGYPGLGNLFGNHPDKNSDYSLAENIDTPVVESSSNPA